MKNTVLIALSHAWESCLVAVKTTLSYFQIWTPIVNMKSQRKLREKRAKKMAYVGKYQSVAVPSKPITNPEFGYVNAAQTNVAETWKKFKQTGVNDDRLCTPADTNRAEHQEVVGQVPSQKIRRIQ
jgi:hypothetical protein